HPAHGDRLELGGVTEDWDSDPSAQGRVVQGSTGRHSNLVTINGDRDCRGYGGVRHANSSSVIAYTISLARGRVGLHSRSRELQLSHVEHSSRFCREFHSCTIAGMISLCTRTALTTEPHPWIALAECDIVI